MIDDAFCSLQVAQGFCHLNEWSDALREITHLDSQASERPAARLIRLQILSALERWQEAAELAQALAAEGQRESRIFLFGALALDQCRSSTAGEHFLKLADAWLDDHPSYHYLLACFACKRDSLNEARKSLEVAIYLDPTYRELALADTDLEDLWAIL